MSERYTSSETPVLAGKFTTGATVTITIIKLSDESVVVNVAACEEVGATGFFKYTYTPAAGYEEYLWTMTDGTNEVAGSFIIDGNPWAGASGVSSSSDSYIGSSVELEAMIGDDPRTAAAALKAASDAAQAWYCQEATRNIDGLILRGDKYDPDQALEFPRIIDGVTVGNADQDAEVPDAVKRACLEEAIAIYGAGSSGGRQALQAQGVASYQIPGILSETFRAGAGSETLLSQRARQIMRRYMGAAVR